MSGCSWSVVSPGESMGSRDRLLRVPILLLALSVAFLATGPAAWAAPIPEGFLLDVQITDGTRTWTSDETALSELLSLVENGTETTLALMAPQTVLAGGSTILDWDSTYDPDPFVTNNFVVVNNSAVSQTYFVSVVAPINPAFPVNSIVQSNIILTLNDDDNLNGATVSALSGTSVYEAFLNGSSALTFLDDPFSNSCASPFDCTFNGISAAAVASQGIAATAATSIGITIRFDLSPGDSAAVQSRFEVVPEPASAMLFGLALATALVCGRRGQR